MDKGVLEDYVRAYMWRSLAKPQGYERAAEGLDLLKEGMTPAQIAKAQDLATEWWEKHRALLFSAESASAITGEYVRTNIAAEDRKIGKTFRSN